MNNLASRLCSECESLVCSESSLYSNCVGYSHLRFGFPLKIFSFLQKMGISCRSAFTKTGETRMVREFTGRKLRVAGQFTSVPGYCVIILREMSHINVNRRFDVDTIQG